MKNETLSYAYDFVHFLAGRMNDNAKGIILFGSVARGDFDRESDVDIFIDTPEKKAKEVRKAVDAAQNEFEIYSRRTWKLQGVDMPIKCIVGDINSKKWSALKREIISSGIILYGRYKELPQELRHCFIFSFSLANLKYKNQVSAIRKIYGYSTKKGRKTYRHAGILDGIMGEKLNPSVVMAPAEGYKKLFDFFRKNRVSFRIREVWTG